ncbi:MutS-related protein [Paenibacillus sp. GYB003]|uniref:MutS-related protein n=1 Tax=Paenibacillus sp. GYB003 TaxID=2994392 RepID=UPI002F96BB61
MTTEREWSLLYPEGAAPRSPENPTADLDVAAALSAETLFGEMRKRFKFKPNQKHPLVYLTDDIDVIRYRLDVVEDVLNHEPLYRFLEKLLPDLEDIQELHMLHVERGDDLFDQLTSVSEIELYVGLIDKLYDFFRQHEGVYSSAALKAFAANVKRIRESESYGALKAEHAKMAKSIRSIKSFTIGVNLDAKLRPAEAGVVAIHTEPFRSGHLIDKLLRVDFGDDGYTCLAPLEAVGKGLAPEQIAAFRAAVGGTLHTVLKSSLKSWRPAIRAYTKANTKWCIGLADEIRFLLGGVSLLRRLLESGVPVCKPEAVSKESKTFTVGGLYNPVTALRLQQSPETGGPGDRVVLNEMQFDEDGMIYILTGPNQGGKTVFVQAVGIAQLLFQLGLFVPAFSAVISPVDRIFAHFPDKEDKVRGGRFADECRRMMHICERLTEHSLLLMDETFSGTSAAEATVIAEQVLLGLREAGCRVLFATHLHDLARSIDRLNERNDEPDRCRIDSLTAEAETDDLTATRSYKISRSRPKGQSYARDIAEKYGLTYERLIRSLGKRNMQ